MVVKTLFAYLERDRILQSTGPFYTEFRFQPQKPSREILARFDANRAGFLRNIFQQAQPGRTWFFLDVDRVGRAIGQPRERIVTALDYLEQQGVLILKAGGVRQGYRLLEGPPADRKALGEKRHTRFLCGLASPAATRARLRQHPQFGIWTTSPFHRVLAFVEQRMQAAP